MVSLIGDKQAHAIQNLLIERIGEDLYLRHRIACGDSATFQGKERDVVFLSMVASPGRAQAQTALLYEQRFNVALSRARDRMYLFRSVEPEHLRNPSDLKFRVIEHFRNPMPAPVGKVDSLIKLCESEFEREVLRRLVELGYRVTPQVAVGEFRIDLVVEGDEDRRLAVELDGDHHHGPERWFEDWSRQKILERVGWRFWRCWASSFALDPDGCMADLLAILDEMRIRPVGAVEFRYTYTEHRIVAAETREPAPSLAVEAEEPEPVVEPGDRVILAFAHEPTRHYAFTISAHEHDPVNCIFSASDPIGRALLNSTVEDELELTWQGESRAATVLAIHKALDRVEAQPQSIPPVAQSEVSVTQTVAAAPAGAALEVEVGDTVAYRSQTGPDDEVLSVRIVTGAGHPERGVVSEDSPIGLALLGLRVGDDAEVALPEGTRTLVVLEIEKGSGLQGGLSRDNVIPLSNPRQTRTPVLPAATPISARAPERWRTSLGRLQVDGSHAFRVNQEPSPGGTIPYVNWQRGPLPDPRNAPLATVVQGLRDIADAEGPILAQRAYQLYARAAGLDRVGRIIRSRLDEVLQAALAQGLLVAEYEHDERDPMLAIIRPPQAPPVIVRTLGDRSFGEIPPSENGEVMRWLLGKKRGIDREQLHRGVLQHYGLIRMTSQVTKELERIYMRFVHEGGL